MQITWPLVCNFILCGKSEEGLKVMVDHFVKICRREDLKINADKSKVNSVTCRGGIGERSMWVSPDWPKCQNSNI